MRAPLVRRLRDEARRAGEDLGPDRVLDVGCGVKPYQPLFAPFAATYVGGDPAENPHAELLGSIEDLPAEGGSFDVVLCNQVLEHCHNPMGAVAGLRRVTAQGGRVLVSTHGVMAYHPSDYGRWTHAGLEKLFTEIGAWASVRVTPASGSTACLGMIVSIYLDLAFRRLRLGAVARPLIAPIDTAAGAVDGHSSRLREPEPGTLFANFHVVAETAR